MTSPWVLTNSFTCKIVLYVTLIVDCLHNYGSLIVHSKDPLHYIYLHCIVAQPVGENDTQGNWPQDTVPGNQILNKLQRQSLHGSLIIVGPKIATFRTLTL